MANQLEIKELTIYKVDVKSISIDSRIEGFSCESYMFLDYEKAKEYAFNVAKKYILEYETMPAGYEIKHKRYDEPNFDVNKLVRSNKYVWPDDGYYWDTYSIFVYNSKLEFNKDIINETEFTA
jgi:hypothetical protein